MSNTHQRCVETKKTAYDTLYTLENRILARKIYVMKVLGFKIWYHVKVEKVYSLSIYQKLYKGPISTCEIHPC